MKLIKINYNNDNEQSVSARELYTFLESKQDFTTWIKSRISKYDFVENIDFTLHKFMEGKNWKHDYIINLDMAKELSMVENNEKGKQARRYFIECEKRFRQQFKVPKTLKEALELALEQQKTIEQLTEKSKFADRILKSKTNIMISELAKLIKQNGVDIGQNRLFIWLRDNEYLIKRNCDDYNTPTQKSLDKGILVIHESVFERRDGTTLIRRTSRVTPKGQQYFLNLFLNKKEQYEKH